MAPLPPPRASATLRLNRTTILTTIHLLIPSTAAGTKDMPEVRRPLVRYPLWEDRYPRPTGTHRPPTFSSTVPSPWPTGSKAIPRRTG